MRKRLVMQIVLGAIVFVFFVFAAYITPMYITVKDCGWGRVLVEGSIWFAFFLLVIIVAVIEVKVGKGSCHVKEGD